MTTQPALGSRAEKRAFYARTLRITGPIALQNFMDAAVSSADVIMLSFVSQAALAASSLAGQVAFVLQMLLFGVSSGASVLAAQYWGKGDRRAVERVMGLSLRITVGIGLLFTLAALAAPGLLMRIFTTDIALISEGEKYLRAVAASYLLGGFCTVYLSVMRSVERVRMSALVHCSAVGMNVVLNACFIFGWAFFPKLGITGVALATSITRLIETAICLLDSQRCRVIRLRARDLIARGGELMRDFMRYAVPAAANDIIWGLAFSVYAIILGHLSSNIVAANSVATVVRNLGTVVCFGMSSSAAIILGKAMGENRLDEARVYATRFCYLSVITGRGRGDPGLPPAGAEIHVPICDGNGRGAQRAEHDAVYQFLLYIGQLGQHHADLRHFPRGRGCEVRPGMRYPGHVGLCRAGGTAVRVCIQNPRNVGVFCAVPG